MFLTQMTYLQSWCTACHRMTRSWQEGSNLQVPKQQGFKSIFATALQAADCHLLMSAEKEPGTAGEKCAPTAPPEDLGSVPSSQHPPVSSRAKESDAFFWPL